MITQPYASQAKCMYLAALFCSFSAAASFVQAEPAPEPLIVTSQASPYVVDGSNAVVRSNFGLCWRTGYWTPALAASTQVENSSKPIGCFCDADLMPAAVCADPAPAVAQVTPPPAVTAPMAPAPSKVTIPADTLFAFDSDELSAAGKTELNTLIAKINGLNLEAIVAVGYTDRIGSMSYNVTLSEHRALTIKNYLVSAGGVEASRIFIEGRGETMAVTGESCNNMGPESFRNKKLVACLAPDRRVDIEAIGIPK